MASEQSKATQSKAMQDLERQIRQRRNEQSLAEGGLTVDATERLSQQATDKHLRFGSNLSVPEFLLTRACGYRPVGQVMGNSVFHVGWLAMPTYGSSEIVALTHALQQARLLAASRLQQEAALLQADGVVGVRLNQNKYHWGRNLIEFSFMGTAVRAEGKTAPRPPFISTLTGQDLMALTGGGFQPVGLVGGNSVWYQVASFQTMLANNQVANTGIAAYYNQELTDFTEGFDTARGLAQSAMQLECHALKASGVVNVRLEKEVFPYERKLPGQDQERTDLIVSFQLLGTAIREATSSPIPAIDYGLLLS